MMVIVVVFGVAGVKVSQVVAGFDFFFFFFFKSICECKL